MMKISRSLCMIALAFLLFSADVAKAEVTGTVAVINGNTVEMNGQRIRLFGVDALELQQVCRNKNNRLWPCGQQSAQALRQAIGGAALRCEPLSRDYAGRIVAVCKRYGDDINAWMVSNGWALADETQTHDYVGAQQYAETAGAGIWSSDFVMPDRWRLGHRLDDPSDAEDTDSQPAAAAPAEDWGPMPLNAGP